MTERNRLIAEPYTRFLVARDLVNLAAAVVLTSVATARRLRIPEDKWVFLHGQADLRERNLLERNDLGEAPAAPMAVRHALEVAEIGIDDVDFFDFYSCFPIAVSNITDALGLLPQDSRGLTLTGGLPYFGGPGNNYSMHAIAEAVERVRASAGQPCVGVRQRWSAVEDIGRHLQHDAEGAGPRRQRRIAARDRGTRSPPRTSPTPTDGPPSKPIPSNTREKARRASWSAGSRRTVAGFWHSWHRMTTS